MPKKNTPSATFPNKDTPGFSPCRVHNLDGKINCDRCVGEWQAVTGAKVSVTAAHVVGRFACMICRKRRKKCDGKRPECGSCSAGGRTCVYKGNETGDMTELEERLKELETRLQEYQKSGAVVRRKRRPQPTLMMDGFSLDLTAARAHLIRHWSHFGLCLTVQRTKALQMGDVTVVHPGLLQAAQLAGSIMYLAHHDRLEPHPLEYLQVRRAEDTMDPSIADSDPVTALQIHQLMAKFYFYKLEWGKAREEVMKAAHVAIKHDRHLVPPMGPIPDNNCLAKHACNREEEELAVLCQLLLLDQIQAFTFHQPLLFPDRCYEELKAIVPYRDSLSIDTYILFARALGIGEFYESFNISRTLPNIRTACAEEIRLWYDRYANLIRSSNERIAYTKMRMQALSVSALAGATRDLMNSMMLAFGTLVNLYALTAHTIEARQRLMKLVLRVMSITQSLTPEDFVQLDNTNGVVWMVVIHVLLREQARADRLLSENDLSGMVELAVGTGASLDKNMPVFQLHAGLRQFQRSGADGIWSTLSEFDKQNTALFLLKLEREV
ncbi:hypothetical protein CYLTODRAFT_492929 [Cylindrobasidium torrendii FP15055 ss-10]|uniref:Zn(2)-C6 fungal-type domain-containing protein n=1 Tax=Cylindrobasidium torrendii FP15055 ss-10 TaxID=1314674 RepID=A0A0D7B392_9AGAR|nr:hypothetical protein CYLTODRAFT_492929 [Cylindrobasidium torrendii FP15055 ss-10]